MVFKVITSMLVLVVCSCSTKHENARTNVIISPLSSVALNELGKCKLQLNTKKEIIDIQAGAYMSNKRDDTVITTMDKWKLSDLWSF